MLDGTNATHITSLRVYPFPSLFRIRGRDTFEPMRILSGALLLVTLPCWGQPPPGYYNSAEGLSGPALRQALSNIISPHSVLANAVIWQAFELTDTKPDGTVWDMYSDVAGGTPPYQYQFGVDQCGTYTGEGDCFNREHTFPQSWYNSAVPMSTDLFHLYPADAWVNQQRGNLAFGTVGAVNWTSQNGSKRGTCNWPGCSGTVFEPISEYKGDLARGFLYMLTRYLPQLGSWDSPMMANGEFLPWAESMLLAWHQADPVSSKEIDRNNVIYSLQGNRNPYIDRPEWVAAIWGPLANVPEQSLEAAKMWVYDATLVVEWSAMHSTADVAVVDAAGRTVLVERLDGPRDEVTLDLAPGVYLARVQQGGLISTLRFVQ